MEIEQVLPEITRYTDGQRLLGQCRRFANVLTEQAWHRDSVLGTKIQREFTRVMTVPNEYDATRRSVTDRKVSVLVNFVAEKEQVGFDEEWQRPEYEELYTLGATLRESIAPAELPGWIIEKMYEKVRVEEANVVDDDIPGDPAQPDDPLKLFEFEKLVNVMYVIGQEGQIDDYAFAIHYVCDGKMIDDGEEYSWSGTMLETDFEVVVVDGEPVETIRQPKAPVNDDDIREFQTSFDTIIAAINEADEFERFEEDDTEDGFYITEDTHCRRALGMLALNARRFIGMRIR